MINIIIQRSINTWWDFWNRCCIWRNNNLFLSKLIRFPWFLAPCPSSPFLRPWKDAYSNDPLYSTYINPCQAAYNHLRQMQPCEPEMWLNMSNIKMSWSLSRKKDYTVPLHSSVSSNVVHSKYTNRPKDATNLPLEVAKDVQPHPKQPTTI